MFLQGGTIRGSLNLPCQSLYPTRPALYTLLKSGGVENVIWYCGETVLLLSFDWTCLTVAFLEGSCGGRGPRAAAWFADYLAEKQDSTMKSLILEGGIKGWAAAGPEYTELMDEYDASVWAKS